MGKLGGCLHLRSERGCAGCGGEETRAGFDDTMHERGLHRPRKHLRLGSSLRESRAAVEEVRCPEQQAKGRRVVVLAHLLDETAEVQVVERSLSQAVVLSCHSELVAGREVPRTQVADLYQIEANPESHSCERGERDYWKLAHYVRSLLVPTRHAAVIDSQPSSAVEHGSLAADQEEDGTVRYSYCHTH